MPASHAPGPWKVDGDFDADISVSIMASDGTAICDVEPFFEDWTDQEMSNTRLIAAAPDMLDALRETRAACAECFRVIAANGVVYQLERELAKSGVVDGFGVRAGSAIAKAEGR